MAVTSLKTRQIADGEIRRADLNISTSGDAVIRRILEGSGLSFSSTGADAGTGDVTINLANIDNNKILGNVSGSSAVPTSLTSSNVKGMLGITTTSDVTFGSLLIAKSDSVGDIYTLKSSITLNNTSPVTGLTTQNVIEMYDSSTSSRVSAQMNRVLYVRNDSATGLPAGSDFMYTLTPVINSSFGGTLTGIGIDGNYGDDTLGTYYRIRCLAGGSGTITNNYAIVVDPNAGLSGFGLTNPTGKVHIKAESSSQYALKVEANSSSSVSALHITHPTGIAPIRFSNLTSSSSNLSGTVKVAAINENGDLGVTSVSGGASFTSTGAYLVIPEYTFYAADGFEGVASNNQVRGYRFEVERTQSFNRLSFRAVSASSGGKASFEIRSFDGTTVLHTTGVLDTTSWGGADITVTFGSTQTLNAGQYLLVWTYDNTTCRVRTANPQANLMVIRNIPTKKTLMTFSGTSTAGVIPSSLGTETASNSQGIPVIILWMA